MSLSPSTEPVRTSTACSGWGIRPSTLPAALQTPAMSRAEPLKFEPGGKPLSVPVKHTTGRYYAPGEMLDRIEADGQVVFRYHAGHNPNGSLNDIAGVCNEQGNVVGLMPHPEHAVNPLSGSTDGGLLFESAARVPAAAAVPAA